MSDIARALALDPDAPMCVTGKRPFRTESAARAELSRARHNRAGRPLRRRGKVECRVYQCPACEWWHLTSKGKWR